MATPLDCEVLVVGAGPTGLMAATLLRRSGVAVRIVEQRTEPTRESRAFAVQARTLELMRSIGLAETFLSQGVSVDGVNIHVKGRFRGGLDFTRANATDTPYPIILMIPQSRTETILAADCEAQGLTIERGVTVASVEQDAAGATTHITTASGEQTIRSAYVIGADGSRSVVRQKCGFGWEGDILPQRFLLADCKVDWPLDHDHFRVFMNGPLVGLFLPLDGAKLSRVMATDTSGSFGDEDASRPAPLDLTEMQAGLERAIALPVKLSDPVWITRYRAHHRFTDRYRSGRAFVAGDAAHIHSPAGGQGMNTGLQDVANLAWKLAAVLRGGADEALLDSYDAERRPVGEQVVKSTAKLFATAAGQSGAKAWMRDRIASALLPLISRAPPFQKKAFFNASQRAIAYPRSDYVGGSAGKVAPGMRAPNGPAGGGDALLDRIAGYRFTLLVLSQTPVGPLPNPPANCALQIVHPGSAELFERYGVAEGGAATLLVRPDGYVAWRGEGVDISGATAFLAHVAGSGAEQPSEHAVAA